LRRPKAGQLAGVPGLRLIGTAQAGHWRAFSVLFVVNPVTLPLGPDPALLLTQEGVSMASVDLNTRKCDGHVVVTLCGVLDVLDAVSVAAALAAVAAQQPEIIVDLAGVDFMDSSGVAALVRGRKHARHAGGDLLLAAPQQQVLRVLAITRLIDVFSVHASVDDAAASAGRSRAEASPAAGRPVPVASVPLAVA